MGIFDLTQHAISKSGVVVGLLVLAVLAAVLQYLTAKQLSPNSDSKRRLRDILSEAGSGKKADQSEVNAVVSRKMMKFMPVMVFLIIIYLPGALAMYMTTANAVGYLQNLIILRKDSSEMEDITNEKQSKPSKTKAKKRADNAAEARVTRIKAKG